MSQHGYKDAFAGSAFHPEFGGKTVNGQVKVQNGNIEFEHAGGRAALPLSGLQARLGGNNNEHLFFQHPSQPDWTISTRSLDILQHPVLRADPQFAHLKRTQAKSGRGWRIAVAALLFVCALFVGLLALVFLQKDRIINAVAEKVPVEWERTLGETVFAQVKAQGKIIDDPERARRVKAITDRLLPVVKASGYEFTFHIMQDTNVNAFAIPGGHVVIHTGLLDAASRPEEVAGVLAHELAHVTRQHSVRQMIGSAGVFLLVQALLGDASGLTAVLADGSRYLLQQKYSRDFEREADDTGWQYLLDARIDPRGMIDFFQKLKTAQENIPGGAVMESMSFLSTHPATQERIQRLEEKWKQVPAGASFEALENTPVRLEK